MRRFSPVLAVALAFASLSAQARTFGSTSAGVPTSIDPDVRTIVVTATGEARVVPDQIFLDFAISGRAKTPGPAMDDVDAAMRKVLKIAAEFGIQPQHVQTAQVQVSEENESVNGRYERMGYRANKSVTLCLKDISKFSVLLRALLEAGVTDVRRAQLTSSKATELQDQAVLKAVANAKKKAEDMVKVLGNELDKTLSVSQVPVYSAGDGAMTYASGAPAGAASGTGQAAGELAYTASVTITFSLK